MENGRDIPDIEMGDPSSAEVGEDDVVDDDVVVVVGVAAAAWTSVGDDDDVVSDPVEVGSGDELEEYEHHQTPQHEPIEEDGRDDKYDAVYILLIHIYLYIF
ncbi:hypothetical protein R1sor_002207 [Riccia sorocarpa]|uniref:Uncharacterized protein n=1 Tax=Riccia sorocarpa TaxID=122646 RepID=A0ABD3H188_9MARC